MRLGVGYLDPCQKRLKMASGCVRLGVGCQVKSLKQNDPYATYAPPNLLPALRHG